MKKATLIFAICFLFPILSFAQTQGLGVWEPTDSSPFQIPKEWSQLKDYRKNWVRLTKLEYSGLHWNQAIVIYINKNYKNFINNYIGYLKMLEEMEDECEEEEEDEDGECPSLFAPYPEGTIILKENYAITKGIPYQPLTVTVMVKHKEGYDPAAGDWEFLQFDAKGKIIVEGKSSNPVVKAVCAECHINMESRDYIFSTFYSPQDQDKINPKKK